MCLLITINIIRWIYGICLRIQKSCEQKNQAKVNDQEIELQSSNQSENFIKYDEEEGSQEE